MSSLLRNVPHCERARVIHDGVSGWRGAHRLLRLLQQLELVRVEAVALGLQLTNELELHHWRVRLCHFSHSSWRRCGRAGVHTRLAWVGGRGEELRHLRGAGRLSIRQDNAPAGHLLVQSLLQLHTAPIDVTDERLRTRA
jgi:hypothetical protein